MNFYDNVTENFKWYEFFKSQTAKRHGINNYIETNYILNNIKNLTENILQPVRDFFGPIRITSGYRSPKLNKIIGGSIYSNHCYGFAADIEPINTNTKMIDIIKWIDDNLEYRELIAEYFPGGWIHVAYRENDNNYQLKLKDDNHNYTHVNIQTLLKLYGN